MNSKIGLIISALLALSTGQSMAQQPGMMGEHHQMMMHHEEMSKIIDSLVQSFAAIENEKDPAVLQQKLRQHGELIKELQTHYQNNSKMMGMRMMGNMGMGEAKTQPMAMEHAEHTMGFSQTETVHHFRLTRTGGVIQVETKKPEEAQVRDEVRAHLAHIAHAFADGDFSDPMAVHGQTPPGVPVLQQLKSEISYQYEDLPQGGEVLIQTKNAPALRAIHRFLRFQIMEHQTGDSGKIN